MTSHVCLNFDTIVWENSYTKKKALDRGEVAAGHRSDPRRKAQGSLTLLNVLSPFEEVDMVFSVYFLDHRGTLVRSLSFLDRADAEREVESQNSILPHQQARVVEEAKFW